MNRRTDLVRALACRLMLAVALLAPHGATAQVRADGGVVMTICAGAETYDIVLYPDGTSQRLPADAPGGDDAGHDARCCAAGCGACAVAVPSGLPDLTPWRARLGPAFRRLATPPAAALDTYLARAPPLFVAD